MATVVLPGLPAGVVAVIWVAFTTTTLVPAFPAKLTVAPDAKFVPLIVTPVPPAVGPLLGETLVTVGGFVPLEGVRKATTCMIHWPDGLIGAVAL
jgi:hypothetical protein